MARISKGLQAFMAQIIDYAGLFPPARLPLEPALANYLRYRQGPDAWMLARFVLPVSRLSELAGRKFQPPLRLSLLGRGGPDAESWLATLAQEMAALAAFQEAHPGQVQVELFEARLPEDLLRAGDPDQIAALADAAQELLGPEIRAFYEIPPPLFQGADWSALLPVAVAGLARLDGAVGFKLRCGGVEPRMIPSASQVAAALMVCHEGDVPLKCTAGLHHPVRRRDPDLGVPTHGFVNVFGAGLLLFGAGLNRSTLEAILQEEDPAAFAFTDQGFAWRDLALGVEALARLRQRALLSFGSCSFDEPRDDLRGLGWLPDSSTQPASAPPARGQDLP